MRQKIKIVVPVFIMLFMLSVWPVPLHAEGTGSVSMSVSSQNVNIGDTVTVSVKALGPSGETAVAVMNIGFDSSVFQFVSCSDSAYGGGGSNVSVTTDSATVTLKAISEGKSNISVSAYNGVVYSSNKDIDSMNGSSTSVAVNNAVSENATGAENLSDDNSLSALTLSEGTLSPSFQRSTTKYTATVPNDVTEVKVSAKPANAKAEIASVTGNNDLKVGTNEISIVVKAENGTTATYKIILTRSEATAGAEESETEHSREQSGDVAQVMFDDKNYTISEKFTEEEIPVDFSETMVTYQGTEYRGLKFDLGELYLLYMVSDDETGKFFVYDEANGMFYPFIKLQYGENYIIPEYNLVYGMNKDGVSEWYQYDTIEGTYQKYQNTDVETEEESEDILSQYEELSKQYQKLKDRNQMILIVMIFCLFALFVSVTLLLARKKKDVISKEDADSEEVYEEEYAGSEETYEEEEYTDSEETYEEEEYADSEEAYEEEEYTDSEEGYEEEEYADSEETYEEEEYADSEETYEEEEYADSEETYEEEEYADSEEAYEEEEYTDSEEGYEEEEYADSEEVYREEKNSLRKGNKKGKNKKVRRGRNSGRRKEDDTFEVIDLNDL